MKRGKPAGSQSWTDHALVQQMNVLKAILQSQQVDSKYLSNQCLLLSKILDSMVANNRKPPWRQDLLPLVQQICKYKDNADARPALLLLLLSVKSAFRTDWLPSQRVTDKDDIFATLQSLFDSFTTGHELAGQPLQCGGSALKDAEEAGLYLNSISDRLLLLSACLLKSSIEICAAWFYPRLEINSVFVAVEAKIGYEVLMCDFHVPHMHMQDRVRLYVGQIDFMETAACLITPPQVNFLVNGQQVEKRVATGYLDVGPQMPSDVTSLVKVGANVLQVIGDFSVSYIIAVASSRTIERSSKTTQLEDYVAPTRATSDMGLSEVDDEVVEGDSRVSLRCPISHQRLVTPVKATTCRHLQCFDFDSFLEINEKRPAWRCPCCNRFISCPDIRIDRQMEKVLKETDEKIYEVVVSQDGTWIPVSTDEGQSNIGTDVSMIEGDEAGRNVIDLSDIGEEPNGERQNSFEFQQPERKPDLQTLQAINENRGAPPPTSTPVPRQRDTLRDPVISLPDITASSPLNSPSFPGPSWAAPSRNVIGGVTILQYPPNQSTPSFQGLPSTNQNFQPNTQATHSQSRTASHLNTPAGPVHRVSPGGGYMGTQLQQPQVRGSSNIDLSNLGETAWVWQRQVGQQSPGNLQDLGQTRQQRQGSGGTLHQLGTNIAQSQSPQPSQQFFPNQSPASYSPRQTPGIITQQLRGTWGGSPSGQWPSNTANPAQVPAGGASASEQNWRLTGRMRGSVSPASVGRGVANQSPPVASSANALPPMAQGMSANSAGILGPFQTQHNANPVGNLGQYQMRMPGQNSPANNVPIYNGTTWVNTSGTPVLFNGVQTSGGWIAFENGPSPGYH